MKDNACPDIPIQKPPKTAVKCWGFQDKWSSIYKNSISWENQTQQEQQETFNLMKNLRCFDNFANFVSADLKEELRPESLPDVSEVASFDASKLKHVETKESNVLPTKEGAVNFQFFPYYHCVN